MYLARLSLDLSVSAVRRDLGNSYDMHRTLSRAFVAEEGDKIDRFLWRLDPGLSGRRPVVLIQSESSGCWGAVEEALAGGASVETRQFDLEVMCANHKTFRFRLLANPTVARLGKRWGLVTEDAQLAWLGRQAERAGFVIKAGLVTGSDVQHSRKEKIRISLRRACFDGILQVTDRSALQQAVRAGVGPGKAFGCGLLSLAPY
ncbi:type I-E CRISPR-associated protein Cas6/Cse3/CasE [Candidimonas nitroreducens]|uniref:Type I-E CRISPR-associated protein Cas6/Cse3/CasE n=1 Tax=Candidimonas nitroreducens TaxID=683354 RepID=A0A225MJR5_9BURK|nr:type I-E CRISPR-associated protein Cas6/Cse3/CasE [Candidimonas nitroreducens]OWT60150.1 type I-E CRISPR-associated protein Cas6/Cse3/CasE [Candidimonas nitroreducens]